jgi:hypothetical protein
VPKLPNNDIPGPPSLKKGTNIVSGSNLLPADQQAEDKTTGEASKDVSIDASDPDKKLSVSTSLEGK